MLEPQHYAWVGGPNYWQDQTGGVLHPAGNQDCRSPGTEAVGSTAGSLA